MPLPAVCFMADLPTHTGRDRIHRVEKGTVGNATEPENKPFKFITVVPPYPQKQYKETQWRRQTAVQGMPESVVVA